MSESPKIFSGSCTHPWLLWKLFLIFSVFRKIVAVVFRSSSCSTRNLGRKRRNQMNTVPVILQALEPLISADLVTRYELLTSAFRKPPKLSNQLSCLYTQWSRRRDSHHPVSKTTWRNCSLETWIIESPQNWVFLTAVKCNSTNNEQKRQKLSVLEQRRRVVFVLHKGDKVFWSLFETEWDLRQHLIEQV